MTFRAGGLISGLDSNGIIEQLMALERRPIQKLQQRQQVIGQKKNAINSIDSALGELSSLTRGLSSSSLLAFRAESSNPVAVAVNAGPGACAGTYNVTVHQLARAEHNRSQAFSSASDRVRAGTLAITVHGQQAVEINIAEGSTLADLAFRINTSGARVRAAVIDSGSGVFLTVYALDSGHAIGGSASDAVVIEENYTGSDGAELVFSETQTAANARFSIDGLLIERRSNTVADAIRGVEITLLSDTAEPSSQLTIAADQEGTRANLQKFIAAYNKLASQLQAQLSYREGQNATPLFADGTLRNLFSRLQTAISEAVGGLGSTLTTLRSVGIKLSEGGQLVLDANAFARAADVDFSGIERLFTASGGIFERLEKIVDDYSSRRRGILRHKTESLNGQDRNLSSQIERLQARVDAYEKRLVAQFTYMEKVLGQLRSQQNSLASIYNLLA